jgi:starch phosphorylase
MLPEVEVSSITNGVHHVHWASAPIRSLLDEHVPGWRIDSSMLRYASDLPLERLRAAHASSKQALLEIVKQRDDVELDASALTIGLARRVTPYKRTLLVFSDPARLEAIAKRHGPIQIVCSGKAHPHDDAGKGTIASLVALSQRFGKAVKVVFLPDYDLELAAALCAGCDLWLNTPQRPLEASGTSGMKAAVNGVPSLSILDGWWLEGWVEGVTGWAIGDDASGDARYAATDSATEEGGEAATEEASGDSGDADAGALYDKLDGAVAPCFFGEPEAYLRVRRSALALNGSFFSTDRMAREYAREIYGLAPQI